MATTLTVLRVFVASPGDVTEERGLLEEIIRELNVIWSNTIGLSLDLVRWETHAYPGMGSDAQAVINEQIADDYDIFVGIMWTRFGTPTSRAGSGTAEEFERAYNRYKEDPNQIRIMFYFNDGPVAPSQLDLNQLVLVSKFKNELGQKGELYWAYTTREEFAQLLRLHLSRQVQAWGKTWGIESQKTRQPLMQPDIPETTTANLDLRDEGFLDLLEIGEQKFALLNSGVSRMATALVQLGERVEETSEEMNRAKSPIGAIDIKQAKRLSNRAAEELENFAELMEVEVPNFADAYSAAIDAYTRAISIQNEMGAEERQEDIAHLRDTIRNFRTVLASSQSSMAAFRQNILAIPRATNLLNRAKKRVVSILDRLDREFATALNLTNEIESVIDQPQNGKNEL